MTGEEEIGSTGLPTYSLEEEVSGLKNKLGQAIDVGLTDNAKEFILAISEKLEYSDETTAEALDVSEEALDQIRQGQRHVTIDEAQTFYESL